MAPRLANRKPTPSAPAREADMGDNARAAEEADRVQFLSFLTRLNDADANIEEARAPLKAAQARRKTVIGLAKAAGFPEWELKRRQDEAKRSAAENADYERREQRQRRWAGIITPEQAKMHLEPGTPDEVRDAADWRSEGYKVGLRNGPATLPDGMDARFTQEFLQGRESGVKDYWLVMAEHAPRGDVPASTVAEQARADFEADNPEVDPGDGFEATAEELAAQKPRTAVIEAREGEVL